MSKVISINTCDQCPHFDNEYWGYNETCDLLGIKVYSENTMGPRPIPKECPLPDSEKE